MNNNSKMYYIPEPIHRGKLRAALGMRYYSVLRRLLWLQMRRAFAVERRSNALPYLIFSHKTPLLRKLNGVDMKYQYNKIDNLKLAAERLDGLILPPGKVLSYWRLIGKPSADKGYKPGIVLYYGKVGEGIGGGLCQMSNLIFWMTLHTPLTVIERHRHGYDVFPDSGRTQPFGSGATCYYPHGDLMIRNDTDRQFQLRVRVGPEYLEGEWRSNVQNELKYEIVEKNHEMKGEYWGGFSRHNELYRRAYDMDGKLIGEEFLLKNSALMMYSPFIDDASEI